MLNRATQGLYPPGSTFKIVTALTALRNIDDIDNYVFDCEGEVTIGNKIIHCYNSRVHGALNIDDAMAVSCNCTFATLGKTVGAAKLRETADSLKVNSTVSFELPLSQSIVSLTRFSNLSELAETSIGQGKTLVTPLYMAMLISSVADDGKMMQPYMVEKIMDSTGATVSTTVPKVYSTVMTTEEADRLTQMLVEVVNRGTGTAAKLNGYQVAGKTGTAQNENENDHSWFVGFASTDNPQVAVAVILENVSGSERATPIGARLIKAVLDKNNTGSINDADYNYQSAPVTPEETENDDINSDTDIVENAVTPEDDYVIGSDEDENTENQSQADNSAGDNQDDQTVPPDSGIENENNADNSTDNSTDNNANNDTDSSDGNGSNAAPDEYIDDNGHELPLINK